VTPGELQTEVTLASGRKARFREPIVEKANFLSMVVGLKEKVITSKKMDGRQMLVALRLGSET
jgi:hypothetical protein